VSASYLERTKRRAQQAVSYSPGFFPYLSEKGCISSQNIFSRLFAAFTADLVIT
jgi:hypothetical protein